MVPHAAVLESSNSFVDASILFRVPKKERLPHVLCVEQGSPSLITRVLALQAVGCHVRSAGPREVSDLVGEGTFQVAVFGHTLSPAETAALAIYMKALSPGTKLVLVTGTEPRSRMMESLFDAIVPEARGLSALAMSVRRLLVCNSG